MAQRSPGDSRRGAAEGQAPLGGGAIATLTGVGLLLVFMIQNTEDVTLESAPQSAPRRPPGLTGHKTRRRLGVNRAGQGIAPCSTLSTCSGEGSTANVSSQNG